MNWSGMVHRRRNADNSCERGMTDQHSDGIPLKPENRLPTEMSAESRYWTVLPIEQLAERGARLVRHPAPPGPSMRTSFEEATVGLASIQAEFDMSLRDLDAANWDELSQQLDRVNEVLQRLVEDVARRPAPS